MFSEEDYTMNSSEKTEKKGGAAMKITFMGAGSTVFARNVLGDCMCTPALQNCEIALYDIDEKRLEDSRIILSAINQNVNEG